FPSSYIKIPLGHITLLAGDSGGGKSHLIFRVMADAQKAHGFKYIILAEDPPGDVEALYGAAGGNTKETVILNEVKTPLGDDASFYLDVDLKALEGDIVTLQPKLILIDPLASFTSPFVDTFKENKVRAMLDPLKRLAAKYKLAVFGIVHFNKSDTKTIYKIPNSVQFGATARSAYIVGFNPDNDDQFDRILCTAPGKPNRGKPPPSFTYRIVGDPKDEDLSHLEWGDETPLKADDINSPWGKTGTLSSKLDQCKQFVEVLLIRGPMPVKDFEQLCLGQGHSSAAIKRARKDLGLISIDPDKPGPGAVHKVALPGFESVVPPGPVQLDDVLVVFRDEISKLLKSMVPTAAPLQPNLNHHSGSSSNCKSGNSVEDIVNSSSNHEPPLGDEPPLQGVVDQNSGGSSTPKLTPAEAAEMIEEWLDLAPQAIEWIVKPTADDSIPRQFMAMPIKEWLGVQGVLQVLEAHGRLEELNQVMTWFAGWLKAAAVKEEPSINDLF
ncbi:MAG: AAA family ATPase, partial [Nitrososphaeraceae archaeon]